MQCDGWMDGRLAGSETEAGRQQDEQSSVCFF